MHSALVVAAVLGLIILLAEKLALTRYGKPLGTALIAIILGALLANIGVIPSASNSIPLYGHIFHYIAPISIFFLTLGVNLKKIKSAGIPMLILFALGSVATVIGVFVAMFIISPESVLGEVAPAIAGMIAGTYTGGSVNFNAIALHYKVNESGVLFAGTVAADNVMTTLWILITLAIPKIMQPFWPSKKLTGSDKKSIAASHQTTHQETTNLSSLMVLIPTALVALLLSEYVSSLWPVIPSILVITTIGLALAQTKYFHELPGSHLLGLYLVYLFLAVIGAFCEFAAINNLEEIGFTLLLFVACVVLIHGLVVIFVGKLLVNDWQMIAIASQANIGGGTTAMALAETFGRKELIVPAILIGTIGNAAGTYLGFMVVGLL
ncbi:DUF819 family protein [Aliikangiella marina]|uniref:DUF819 family protein n=2 Tax=Aliikangiella marina TaxID=1712262 RepID=A0A545TAA5_9GAMM|nr:DUF819 family protein [Aliikangiella marina]